MGASTTTKNGIVASKCDVIFLAVKPHILPTAVANIYETFTSPVKGKLFVSILAGITLAALENVISPYAITTNYYDSLFYVVFIVIGKLSCD